VLVGGRGSEGQTFSDVATFSLTSSTWTTACVLPGGGLHSHSACAFGNSKVGRQSRPSYDF
jgi:hypothetical protein